MWSIFPCAFIILHLVNTICILKVASSNLALFGILLQWFSQDISWGQVSFRALLDLWLLRALQHLCYGFPSGSVIKNPPAVQETWVQSLGQKAPPRRKWQPTAVFLPGKPHGQRSLLGCSPQGHTESDMTEWLNNSSSRSNVCISIWTR